MTIEIIIEKEISIKKESISESLIKKLKSRLILENPLYAENKKHGYSNYQTPEHLEFIKITPDSVVMPRGFLKQLKFILEQNGAQNV